MDGGVDLFTPATNPTGILDSMGVARPAEAAEEALARLGAAADRFLLHLDVDVVDFLDLPVADIPQHNDGLTFDEAMTCLAMFARHPGLAGVVVTELNPDHGAEDGSTADALARGLAGALAGRPAAGRDGE